MASTGSASTRAHFCQNLTSGARHSGAVSSMFRLKADRIWKICFTAAGHRMRVLLNMDSTCA